MCHYLPGAVMSKIIISFGLHRNTPFVKCQRLHQDRNAMRASVIVLAALLAFAAAADVRYSSWLLLPW